MRAALTPVRLPDACTPATQDPPAAFRTPCEEDGTRRGIGPGTRLDARPRPECRPSAAPSR